MNDRAVGNVQVAKIECDFGGFIHGAADQGKLAPVLECHISDELDAVYGRGEARDEQPPLGARENFLETWAHCSLARRVARPLDIGRVLKQHKRAFLAVLRKLMQVKKLAIGWSGIDFEIAGMNYHADWGLDRQRYAIDQTMSYSYWVDQKRTDAEALVGTNFIELGGIEQFVLLQLAFN